MKDIKVGTCGWGFFRAKDFLGDKYFKSILQAYVSIYPVVEINTTFYRIPKLSTAEKWRREASEINKEFEFTVKASELITHRFRFSKASVKIFNIMKDICKNLDSKILLFQSPASFKATSENIKRMEDFFSNIKRGNLILSWEPRGNWHDNPKLIKQVCKDFDLIECVDPFRNDALAFGKKKIGYFRLHGFGIFSMYSYNFSANELNQLKEKVSKLKKLKEIYIFFNNSTMYENAIQFMKFLEK